MYIGSKQADEALEILTFAHGELLKSGKSELDAKIADAISDAIKAMNSTKEAVFKDVDSAVACYVAMRDELGIDRKSWEAHEQSVNGLMDTISMWLRDRGDEMGVNSFSTPSGTAYRNVKTSYRVEAWPEFAKWILETNNLQCIEKRPAKLAVKEIHDATGSVPPGLNLHVEVEFNVRKPTKKSS